MLNETVFETNLPLPLIGRGKVRDIYELGQDLLIVSTDRLSAFDVVFPDPIPCKGLVLQALSLFWFDKTRGIAGNHLAGDTDGQLGRLVSDHPMLEGRAMRVRRATVMPVECVVRGYLDGSAYKSYEQSGGVCGIDLPPGLRRREKLSHPIFTPTTKATHGHDEPISFETVVQELGAERAEQIRLLSLRVYQFAHDYLLPLGITLSDTKFEFGVAADGGLMLVDEVLTPDSSRYWESATYHPDEAAVSLDKQFVRDYVEGLGWDKKPPAPELPPDVVAGMRDRYLRICELVTGSKPDRRKGH